MNQHHFPYQKIFQRHVPNLGSPNDDGWATGSCPYCGESETFHVNLKTGHWTCLPMPTNTEERILHDGEIHDERTFPGGRLPNSIGEINEP